MYEFMLVIFTIPRVEYILLKNFYIAIPQWSGRLSKDYEFKTFYQENICIILNLQILLRRF